MSDSENSVSTDEGISSKPLFAAIKFFCDKSVKINHVAIEDIQHFDITDLSRPKRVKYGVDDTNEVIFEPAQILAVAG